MIILLCLTQVRLAAGDVNEPFGVAFDAAGHMYIAEYGGHQVKKLDPKRGSMTVFAGTGDKGFGGDGGPALKAQFNSMHSIASLPNGDLYIADSFNNRVRKIDAKTGIISTAVGIGERGFSGDGGPATQAKFGNIYCAAFDPKGTNLYLADLDNRRIRAVDMATGIVSTVAGNGQKGVPEDGAVATQAPLFDPRAAAADSKGNVYVLERSGNALRVVNASGKIRTLIKPGALKGPKHLCLDLDENVLIADAENHVIRRYFARDGRLAIVAGTGKKGSGGVGGPPEQVELARPHGVCVHSSGTIIVSDSENHRVLRIDP